jgi:hypothetical protein
MPTFARQYKSVLSLGHYDGASSNHESLIENWIAVFVSPDAICNNASDETSYITPIIVSLVIASDITIQGQRLDEALAILKRVQAIAIKDCVTAVSSVTRHACWAEQNRCVRKGRLEMRKSVKSTLAAALCGATALAALPSEVTAGPTGAASPTSVVLTTSVEKAYYRGYRRGYYPRYGGYYRRGYGGYYGAGTAAGIAGAAAGLLGAGIAGASGYGYPGYGYGGGYGGSSCWQWDPGAGWVWGCR